MSIMICKKGQKANQQQPKITYP